MPILQPVGTPLVEEIDVFYEQAEERDDNLQRQQKEKGISFQWEDAEGNFHMTQRCAVCINNQFKGRGLQWTKRISSKFISWENKPAFALIKSMFLSKGTH